MGKRRITCIEHFKTKICHFRPCSNLVNIPISPLLEDSVNEGVPSVHVGVEPSTEAGGVQAKPLEWLECPAPELPDSTLNVDLFSVRDSNLISDTLKTTDVNVPFNQQGDVTIYLPSTHLTSSL